MSGGRLGGRSRSVASARPNARSAWAAKRGVRPSPRPTASKSSSRTQQLASPSRHARAPNGCGRDRDVLNTEEAFPHVPEAAASPQAVRAHQHERRGGGQRVGSVIGKLQAQGVQRMLGDRAASHLGEEHVEHPGVAGWLPMELSHQPPGRARGHRARPAHAGRLSERRTRRPGTAHASCVEQVARDPPARCDLLQLRLLGRATTKGVRTAVAEAAA